MKRRALLLATVTACAQVQADALPAPGEVATKEAEVARSPCASAVRDAFLSLERSLKAREEELAHRELEVRKRSHEAKELQARITARSKLIGRMSPGPALDRETALMDHERRNLEILVPLYGRERQLLQLDRIAQERDVRSMEQAKGELDCRLD